MLVKARSELASRVSLREEFTKGENSPFQRMELAKNSIVIGEQLGAGK